MIKFLFIGLYLLFSCGGMVLIKYGSNGNGFNIAERAINFRLDLYSAAGLFFYALSFIMWIIVLQKFKLSYISPLVSGISYVIIILLSYFVLDEKISINQWAGIVVIFVGVILMNLK